MIISLIISLAVCAQNYLRTTFPNWLKFVYKKPKTCNLLIGISLSNAPFTNCHIDVQQLAAQFLEEINQKHQFTRSCNEPHSGKHLLLNHVILKIVNNIIWERNGCFCLLRDIITFDRLLPMPSNCIITLFITFGNRQEDCL